MSIGKRRLQGHLEAFAGQRGAGHNIHVGRLRLNRFLLKIRDGNRIDLLRSAAVGGILQELNGRDLPILNFRLNLHNP